MKVLLLTKQGQYSYISSMYKSLRTCVGTCDLFELNTQHLENLKVFFDSHIKLEHFDRLVFLIEPHYIRNQLRFITTLPNVVFLEQDGAYDKSYLAAIERMFDEMPWMRFIVSGYHYNRRFIEAGMDSYFVQTTYDASRYNILQNKSSTLHTYLYDPFNTAQNSIRSNNIRTSLKTIDNAFFNEIQAFNQGDILIYLPGDERIKYEQRIIQAMASGVVVITPNLGVEENQFNKLVNGENICLFDDSLSITQIVNYLHDNTEKRFAIAEHAAEDALFFSTENVGNLLGEVVMQPMRERRGYRKKLRIFGMRF